MKKLLLSFMALMCCCLLIVSAHAKQITNYDADEYVRLLILSEQGIEITPTISYNLLDTSGRETYCCVEFSHSEGKVGYAIIDLTDYSVVMYSIYNLPPFSSEDTIICGGILNFAVVEDNESIATIIGADIQVPTNGLFNNERDGLEVLSIEDRGAIIKELEKTANKSVVRSVEPTTLSCTGAEEDVFSAGWNSGNYETDCGINAAAMFLNYLDKYYDDGYLPQLVVGEEKIKIALSAYTTSKIKDNLLNLTLSELATICNGYTKQYGTVATNIASSQYTFTKLKNRINNGTGKPCILRIPGGSTEYWPDHHFVIGLGYSNGATSSTGTIHINSGWTSLKFVNIPTSAPTHIGT